MKFNPGDMLPTTVMEAVTGEAINLPDAKRLVHLQFRRFVDCPICNTHIAEFRRRARETEAAGVKEVIVFHSSPKSIRSYQKDVPFLMVGDPKKAFLQGLRGRNFARLCEPQGLGGRDARDGARPFRLATCRGPLGLPADFLIAPSGRINAVKYGADAYDQWSVDELLTLAKGVAAQAL
jgi:peroxiredoxin